MKLGINTLSPGGCQLFWAFFMRSGKSHCWQQEVSGGLQRPARTLARAEDFPQGAVPFSLEFLDEKKKKVGGLQGILQGVVGDKGRQPVLAAEFGEVV